MLHGSEIISIIHHVHYKATNSICPKLLVNLTKGETTIMRCATSDSNIFVPQKIQWSDINVPEDWSLQSDTLTPKPENIENTSLHSITQTEEGLVKIKFDKTVKINSPSISENLKENFNYLNICDKKLDKNYQYHLHRSSTSSSIRSGLSKITNYFDTKTRLSEISNQSNISKGIYTKDDIKYESKDSETISPTYFEMKSPSQFMMIRIDIPFEINKDFIRKDFLYKRILKIGIISLKNILKLNKMKLEWHGMNT
ncbi:hypothetical protein CFOL_v3_19420 [Cephalotus follicularis]|uniref:MP domain-containing protein n=1 Tax=Cephalotus follicularis TaxID=3775 RepID=A0A1Q3C6Y2_CEPFO|nr:hypothetical protein CFOL_v3_19420 [Cephalotus follicularis]